MTPTKTPIGIMIILALVFIIGVGGFVGAIGSYPPVDENMVLYYHFNNQSAYGESDTLVYDFSGNGNNGTANNTIWDSTAGILGDGAMKFNNIENSSIEINNIIGAINLTGNFSIMGWVYRDGGSNGHVFAQTRNTNDRFDVSTTTTAIKFGYYNGSIYYGVEASNIADKTWTHFVYTYDNNISNLYIDGLESGTYLEPSAKLATNKIYLGKSASGVEPFNGSIDDFIVYNKTLSQSEVTSIYNKYLECGNVPFDGCNVFSNTVWNGGTYYFNNTINVVSNNTILDGNGTTLIVQNKTAIQITKLNNITIKNLNIISHTNSSNEHSGIYGTYLSNITLKENEINISCWRGCFGIRIQTYSYGLNVSNSNFNLTTYGDQGVAIYFTRNIHNSYVGYNNIFTSGLHTMGVHLEGNSSENLVEYNTMFGYTVAGNPVYIEGRIITAVYNLTDIEGKNNIIQYNNITSTFVPIQLESNANYNIIRHNWLRVIGTGTTGIRIQDLGNEWGTPSYCLNSESCGGANYNNITNNTIICDYRGIRIGSNTSIGNIVDENKIYSTGLYGITLVLGTFNNYIKNNYVRANYSLYQSTNATNNTYANNDFINGYMADLSNSFFIGLTSSLLHNSTSLCNGTTNLVTGNINITLQPNEFCYVLDNFNLTEGQNRQYSPIWFSSSTTTEKHIASNLSESVTALVISNIGHDCDELSKIIYTPKGQASITYTGSQARRYCSEGLVSLTLDIYPSSESNILQFEYQTSQLTSTILKLLIGFLALAVCIFSIGIFYTYVKDNFQQLNMDEFIKMSIALLLVLILVIALMSYIATLV